MKRVRSFGWSLVLVLSVLALAMVAQIRCTNAEAAVKDEKADPCAAPNSDPTFVQTSTAMIEARLTVKLHDRKQQEIKREVFVDGSDTDHVTFETIYVSQGPHVVKLAGDDYTPPCRVVTITDDTPQETGFVLAGAK
jgi:hypothetical protein